MRESLRALMRDVRFGLRGWKRMPAFTALLVLVLGLGIGGMTLVFTLVNGVLLRPLPYPFAEQLVMLQELSENGQRMTVSYPNFVDWRERATRFDGMVAGYTPFDFTSTGRGDPYVAQGMGITRAFFEVVGVPPALGRAPLDEEHRPGGAMVVVVSHEFWRDRLDSEPDFASLTLNLEGNPAQVVGVMPPGFRFFRAADFWYPIEPRNTVNIRNAHNHWVVGRRSADADLAAVRAEMDLIAAALREEYPRDNGAYGIDVRPLLDEVTESARTPLLMLLVAGGLVLLLACVNVAGALLAHGRTRSLEMAVRVTIGASSLRVLRQLLAEGALLALAGAIAGIGLTLVSLRALQGVAAGFVPRLEESAVDAGVLLFTVGITMVTVLLFALWPALAMTRDAAPTLRGSGRGNTRAQSPAWRALLGIEIALAVGLVIAAGLLIRSILAIHDADVGYRTERVFSIVLPLTGAKYGTNDLRLRFVDDLTDELSAIPAVAAFGFVSDLPLDRSRRMGPVLVTPYADPEDPQEWDAQAGWRIADADYFAALDIPLRAGRLMSDEDREGTPGVVVINESLAERLWPGQDPLGRELRALWDFRGEHLRVIGVVGEARHWRQSTGTQPELYVHWRQRPEHANGLYAVVRTETDPRAVLGTVRTSIRALDSDLYPTIATMDERLSDTAADKRFTLIVLGALGVVAFFIAIAGTYAVVSHAVAQRRSEMGIRLALGGSPAGVLRMVLAETLRWVMAGALAGVLAALAGGRLLEGLLFGVTARDPLTYLGVVLMFGVAAFVAGWLPARRAARIDPAEAMRVNTA